jgi:hypothetical protein
VKEFIKIKNADGSGEIVLRKALVQKIQDLSNGGALIIYGDNLENSIDVITALTASQVLEAIEGQSEPRRLVSSGGSGPYNYRVTVPSAHDADSEQGAVGGVGVPGCRCSYRPGDNLTCPVHHGSA